MAQSRIVGGNIGLSLATIILNRHSTSGLKDVLTSKQITSLRKSLTSIESFTPEQRVEVSRVFSDAFKTQIEVCAVLGAVCLILCIFAWDRDPPSFAKLVAEQKEKENSAEAIG